MITLPNTQPAEAPDRRGDGSLDVINVFRTIQGEGPLSGLPAVFIRLAGCNLDCPLCDTQYTDGRGRRSFESVAGEVFSLAVPPARGRKVWLAVLTGGEPFRQNVTPLVKKLLRAGMGVQVETNGTHYLPAYPYNRWGVFTVVSPKTPKIAPNLILHVDALKYVLEAGHVDPDDGLPTSVLGNGLRPFRPWEEIILAGRVYVQPADCQDPERNAANRLAAVESCLRFGYRLGSQLHKVVGLD